MGFAFVAILGLVPVALTSFRDTKTAGVSSQISQQIIAQAQVAPFSALTTTNQTAATLTAQGVTYTALRLQAPPEPSGSSSPYMRFFNDQGVEVLSTDATGIYQVNSRVLVGPPFVQSVDIRREPGMPTWLGLTVQVAYNPGKLTLDIDERSLDGNGERRGHHCAGRVVPNQRGPQLSDDDILLGARGATRASPWWSCS